MRPTLVVGVGNAHRGDDRAGIAVARLLRRCRARERADVAECGGDVGALVEALGGRQRVIVVDACRGGDAPGGVRRFEAHREPLPAWLDATSTHGLGLAAALELARGLGRLPPEVTVYAITGLAFGLGDRLSPPVRNAVRDVARHIALELGDGAPQWPRTTRS